MSENELDGMVTADDITTRGVYVAKSAEYAKLPPALVREAVKESGVVQDKEGLWNFEQLPVSRNQILRVRPVAREFFKYEKIYEWSTLKVVTRDLDELRPVASMYGRIHVYFGGGAALLYAWGHKSCVYVRRAWTEEQIRTATSKDIWAARQYELNNSNHNQS